ncbi:hypothetical protein [Streptomyces sp. WAC08241]|uniref:hypothetical protein n=1 Tax=Streptomyces sp. WAC08241 TaxID=2487421 RepID=UPI000F7A268C|nr:hypothetical protein [Streptomyces sp. WAC08241]RSS37461.1 hypothetical protein EF906_23080 [Streptomyces sp. WAC08241]
MDTADQQDPHSGLFLSEDFPDAHVIDPASSATSKLTIGSSGRPLVTLDLETGEMTFSPDYTPDAAAEMFWGAVDAMGLVPIRQENAATAAKNRAWELVAKWRAEATARGEDPYRDPHAQALAAALTESATTDSAT